MLRQLRGGKVCIPPHHTLGFPSAHLLHYIKRRSILHEPACPGVAQIVPAEVFYSRSLQCVTPCPSVCMGKTVAAVCEYPRLVLTDLPPQHPQCDGV